jgi:hypothetical protein
MRRVLMRNSLALRRGIAVGGEEVVLSDWFLGYWKWGLLGGDVWCAKSQWSSSAYLHLQDLLLVVVMTAPLTFVIMITMVTRQHGTVAVGAMTMMKQPHKGGLDLHHPLAT